MSRLTKIGWSPSSGTIETVECNSSPSIRTTTGTTRKTASSEWSRALRPRASTSHTSATRRRRSRRPMGPPILPTSSSLTGAPPPLHGEDRRQLAGPVGRVAPLSEGGAGCPLARVRADRRQDPRDRLFDQMGALSHLARHKTAVLLCLLLVSASDPAAQKDGGHSRSSCEGTATVAGTSLATDLVAEGFTLPVHLAAPPHDVNRLFVVEQDGAIKIIKSGRTLPQPFLDIRDRGSVLPDLMILMAERCRSRSWISATACARAASAVCSALRFTRTTQC